MRRLLWIPVVLTACAGGGSHQYTEADNRNAVSADLGTTFYVSLPAAMTGKVVFSPKVLSLAKDSVDGSQRRILEFSAGALGETEIKVGNDYSLRVHVGSASDRPAMRVHTR